MLGRRLLLASPKSTLPMLHNHAIIIVCLLAGRIERDECRRDLPKYGGDDLLWKASPSWTIIARDYSNSRDCTCRKLPTWIRVSVRGATFGPKRRVDHHAGHRLLNEEVEEGITKPRRTHIADRPRLHLAPPRSVASPGQEILGLIAIAVTSTHSVLNRRFQADIRRPVDFGRLERLAVQRRQFRGLDRAEPWERFGHRQRHKPTQPGRHRRRSELVIPFTTHVGNFTVRRAPSRLLASPASADTAQESPGSLRRRRRRCRIALPLPVVGRTSLATERKL